MATLKIDIRPSKERVRPVVPRRAAFAGTGRLRKVALLGGARTLNYTPWHDPTWELWAHMSCRHLCVREPDVYFDLHPEALWRNPEKKYWDKKYLAWVQRNRVPIYMQEQYPDVPSSMRYPFETMITEFPRGYMTNTVSYMVALALMQGVTHLGVFGCHYDTASEMGPQRGSCEYWLGVAEGRGVHVQIPPLCDLLNRPALLYGYQSHPDGVRDPSYTFGIGVYKAPPKPDPNAPIQPFTGPGLVPADAPDAPPLRDIGAPPALHRRAGELTGN